MRPTHIFHLALKCSCSHGAPCNVVKEKAPVVAKACPILTCPPCLSVRYLPPQLCLSLPCLTCHIQLCPTQPRPYIPCLSPPCLKAGELSVPKRYRHRPPYTHNKPIPPPRVPLLTQPVMPACMHRHLRAYNIEGAMPTRVGTVAEDGRLVSVPSPPPS